MRILAFESSAKAAGTALLEDGSLRAEAYQNSGMTHSCTLMQMAEDMLRTAGLTVQDIDAAAVAAGPGSFTGVRIGAAAAKGLAWGREIPCYGVSTLEAMALGAACTDGVYCCCMDARRAQVYNAIFEAAAGALRRLGGSCNFHRGTVRGFGENRQKNNSCWRWSRFVLYYSFGETPGAVPDAGASAPAARVRRCACGVGDVSAR